MARLVASGREIERAPGFQRIGRHHHESPYAALVLRGGYVEAGDRGRIRAEAGDVLFHDAFEGHCDCVARSGAQILNLPLSAAPAYAHGACQDPDEIARIAEHDHGLAADMLIAMSEPASASDEDWPDKLAAALRTGRALRLDEWAADHGLTPSALSRGFRLAYGASPKRFRLEVKGSSAARRIQDGAALGDTAFACGFADQPHLTRTVTSLFGRPPGTLQVRSRPAD